MLIRLANKEADVWLTKRGAYNKCLLRLYRFDNNPISVNYADENSVLGFKKKIKSVIIRKVTFKTIVDSIGQQLVWRTLIDISTKLKSDSIFHFSNTGIWLKIPAFISYKCFTIDTNGKFVKEILSHPAYHYPITIRNMTKQDIGINNILTLYFFDNKIIQTTFCKLWPLIMIKQKPTAKIGLAKTGWQIKHQLLFCYFISILSNGFIYH